MKKALLILVLCTAGLPGVVSAQAAIAGRVRDSAGAPLPAVVVEVSSPALIERARTATTDAAGRYRIEDLRPGLYAVTFTLQGWRGYQREGVELTGSSTVTVNAELVLSTPGTTVIVRGASPIVDVHNAGREVSLGSDLVRGLPTVRSYNAMLGLIPGVVTSVNDIVVGTATTAFPIHGGRTTEGRLMLDGLTVGSPPSGNSATNYFVDVGHAREITFSAGGALAEAETAGLVMNIVPQAGGNVTRGSIFLSGAAEKFHSDNLTPELRARGVTAATPLSKVYDVGGTIGGPIVRDRIWYFVTAHVGGNTRESANVYYNLNAGDPNTWLYAPDLTRRAYSDRTYESASGRLTWQVSEGHKLGVFWDAQALCRTCSGATPGLSEPARVSPEAVGVLGRPLHVTQATWASTWTDRLLFEAGYGGTSFGVGNFERQPNPTRDLIRVMEQCATGCAANGGIPGLVYRSQDFSDAHTASLLWKGSVSYVTGTHSLKVGYQHTYMTDDRMWMTNTQNLTYRVSNGVPNQLTQSISPWVNDARVAWTGVFAQQQWTHHRLTVQGALRFDRATSWFPEQQLGPSRFLPLAIVIPETKGVDSYKDVSPRFGAAYDISGTSTTVLKLQLGRYLDGAGVSGTYANTNPTLRMPQTTMVFGTAGVTRTWTDANQNFIADCDLLNAAAQDLRAAGDDFCGAMSNANFGRYVLTNSFDPRILDAWFVRPSDWNLSAAIEHQVFPRASIAATFTRRWFKGFTVVDNLALEAADLTPFSVTAPLDPRLPGGGGYVVSGLYDVVPEKLGAVNNYITAADGYGKWSQHFTGADLTFNLRSVSRFTFVGGASIGQTVADNCAVRERLPELSTATTGTSAFGAGLLGSAVTTVSPYCRVAYGTQTQFRGLAAYTIPRFDVDVSTTIQSKPGPMLAANYAAPNSAVAPSLGRDLSGNAPNVTVNLIPPGTLYGDRINEVDLRVAKTLRFGSVRAAVAVEIYNALNASPVLMYNTAFVPGGTWLQPMTVLTPRFFKLSAEVDF
jgi:hypothetical protein